MNTNLLVFITFSLCVTCYQCLAQEPKNLLSSVQPKPAWWYKLKESDLCIRASAVSVDETRKEFLTDGEKKVIAEYFPVKLKIERVLFASSKMLLDGRFSRAGGAEFSIPPKYSENFEFFLVRKLSGAGSTVDSYTLDAHPKLPTNGIFTLIKSDHKKGGEFIISAYTEISDEKEYIKAIEEGSGSKSEQ